MKTLMWTLSVAILLSLTSCTEPQRLQVDRLADQAGQVTEIGQQVLQSPLGAFIPLPWAFWITLAG